MDIAAIGIPVSTPVARAVSDRAGLEPVASLRRSLQCTAAGVRIRGRLDEVSWHHAAVYREEAEVPGRVLSYAPMLIAKLEAAIA